MFITYLLLIQDSWSESAEQKLHSQKCIVKPKARLISLPFHKRKITIGRFLSQTLPLVTKHQTEFMWPVSP